MKFRFYIAWVDGSDGACGDETKIKSTSDLVPEYNKGNEHVSMRVIEADTIEQALDKGYRWAFFENFTACDTLTDIEIDSLAVQE